MNTDAQEPTTSNDPEVISTRYNISRNQRLLIGGNPYTLRKSLTLNVTYECYDADTATGSKGVTRRILRKELDGIV